MEVLWVGGGVGVGRSSMVSRSEFPLFESLFAVTYSSSWRLSCFSFIICKWGDDTLYGCEDRSSFTQSTWASAWNAANSADVFALLITLMLTQARHN